MPRRELRQDVTTGDWVLFAPERAARPSEIHGAARASVHEDSRSCPFCPGNEHLTPPELERVPGGDADPARWAARVVPNRFPALASEHAAATRAAHPWFPRRHAVGAHEVVIETPKHDLRLTEMSDDELGLLFEVYQRRYHVLRSTPGVRAVLIFRNHGPAAGTSIVHPHSQIIATPVETPLLRRRYPVARDHYEDHGTCLYCDLRDEERRAGDRVLFEREDFVALLPFASRWPYEVWVLPCTHRPSFGDASDDELIAAARALRRALRMLRTALGDPAFNYVIHSSPVNEEEQPFFIWHIQVVPRLAVPAGFELGSGMMINTALPEQAAELLRAQKR